MEKVFIILGYGVPKNIMADTNYIHYLSEAFNKIFDAARGEESTILFCGGHTDCYPLFKRTEAEEMAKLFKSFATREFVKIETKRWKYIKERRSVCRLENFLYAYEYLVKNKIKNVELTIFCEYTRRVRAG